VRSGTTRGRYAPKVGHSGGRSALLKADANGGTSILAVGSWKWWQADVPLYPSDRVQNRLWLGLVHHGRAGSRSDNTLSE